MQNRQLILAALGCTGHVTENFVDGFLGQGIKVRLLARNPQVVAARYPAAEVITGNMMHAADVARVMQGADAALLVTPMGVRGDTSVEPRAVVAAVEGVRATKLPHLILVSSIGIDQPVGLPLLDAKHAAERILATGGIAWTSMRCGSYMEDVINPQLSAIRRGIFPFPVSQDRRFTYTCQADLPRFVVQELLRPRRVLNRAFNFVAPGTYTPSDLARLMTQTSGRKVRASGKFPLLYLLTLLMPYFNWRGHRFSTIVPLLHYFDQHGYTAPGDTVGELFPKFRMTTLEEHIRGLFAASGRTREVMP
ncbi:MAG TPA: NAD(P)H-binding protein [Syntrophorhabdaceae bacterium]|nr:NAD(P)H-binding protein [Syntrophorhabdaceae bacterium]HPA07238.1 NAD(P)H-binding protein [Methanoregulaceae archaeon]